jgi:hypothetical protein
VAGGYTKRDLEEFYDAYVETALWSSNDESDESGGEPMDRNYGVEDFAPSAEDKMVADCKRFLDRAWPILDEAPVRIHGRPKMEMAGYHFWLTRNGHGVSFEDGEWPEDIAEKLTALSHKFHDVDLYVGDDGKIYV